MVGDRRLRSSLSFNTVDDGAVEPGHPPVPGDDADDRARDQARPCTTPAGSLSVGERQALGPKDFLHPPYAKHGLEVKSRPGRSVDGQPLNDASDLAVRRVDLVGDDDVRRRVEDVADL